MIDLVEMNSAIAATTAAMPRSERRLTDRVLAAFHAACDVRDVTTAYHLMKSLDQIISRSLAGNHVVRIRELELLVGAYFRLLEVNHELDTIAEEWGIMSAGALCESQMKVVDLRAS